MGEDDTEPEQHLDEGENIERIVVPLSELHARLMEYSKKEGTLVDARSGYNSAECEPNTANYTNRLFHWAAGIEFARTRL